MFGGIFEYWVSKSVGLVIVFILLYITRKPESFKDGVGRFVFLIGSTLVFTHTMMSVMSFETTPLTVTTAAAMTSSIAYVLMIVAQVAAQHTLRELAEISSIARSKRKDRNADEGKEVVEVKDKE